MLEFRLLGQFEIRLKGQPVELPSRPAQSLLAYLLIKPGTAHRREKLAGMLWPDAADSNARAYLRQALWRIRKALEPGGRDYVLADDLAVAFEPGADYRLDIADLERQAAAGASTDALVQCLSVYQGEFLPGFYDEWVLSERERLQAVFEQRMQLLLDRLVAERRWSDALEWGERWIALGHVPEPAYQALMVAHHGLGNRSGVVAVFQRCQEALRRELGVEPSEPTQALYRRLSSGASAGERTPGISSLERKLLLASVPPSDLPRQITSFIGRERETAEVKRLLAASRLVTLTGVGGCGKTRLALHVSRGLLASYPQGVWFVELASLADPALVPKTVAAALGLLEEPGRPFVATLAEYLRPKTSLLILDNCEHLIEACAQLTEALLRACSNLHILTSSREALGITGEIVFQVPSMSTPDTAQSWSAEGLLEYEAVRLFADRATMAAPGFSLAGDNAPAIAEICRRLDGIPLAIELAAARMKMLRPEQIAARLNDRLRLLTGGSRTALPRQQTLRATMDWSYNLLSEAERALLRSLSVFVDGWTLEAAEAIAHGAGQESSAGAPEEVLDLLTQLVNKSLVIAGHEQGEDPRYRLLETIRHYAREKLLEAGESADVRNRHLGYFVALAGRAEPELTRPDQVAWLNRLEAELGNIRAALEWALENEAEAGLLLASTLGRFWDAHGRSQEGGDWLARLLQRTNSQSPAAARAKALAVQGNLLVTQSVLSEARSAAEAGLALFRAQGDQAGEAYSLMTLGQVLFMQGDVVSARPLLEASLALYQALGDRAGQADALSWLSLDRRDADSRARLEASLALNRELGHLSGIAGSLVGLAQQLYWEGDYATPPGLLEEAMSLERQLGSKGGMAWVAENYANLAFRQGDYERARTCYEESIRLTEETGQHLGVLWARVNLAHIALRQGEAAQAQAIFEECIRRFHEARINIGVVYGVEGLASLAARQGRPEPAARLFGWAEAMREAIGDPRPPVEQAEVDRDLALSRAQLEEAAFAAAWAEGRAMRANAIEQVIARASAGERPDGLPDRAIAPRHPG